MYSLLNTEYGKFPLLRPPEVKTTPLSVSTDFFCIGRCPKKAHQSFWQNSVYSIDSDQIARSVQGLHCLPSHLVFYETTV